MAKSSRPIQAALLRERRTRGRYLLQLSAASTTGLDRALVHDLSEVGLRLETTVPLDTGDKIRIELPLIGQVDAKVMWKEDAFIGCKFLEPISQSVVNAAILRSSIRTEALADLGNLEEIPIGVNPTLETITAWKVRFDELRGESGYRIVGFRQTADGLTIAMVTRTD